MRILFVAPYLPSPVRFRSLRIIQGLANLGLRVSGVALCNNRASDRAAYQTLTESCEAVHLVPLSRSGALMQSALHLATNTPLWAASHFSPSLNSTLTRLLAEKQFDIGHVEHLRIAYVAPLLRKHMPVVFDAVDSVTDQHQTRLEDTERGTIDRIISQKVIDKIRKYEPVSASQFDKVLISTEQGASRLM